MEKSDGKRMLSQARLRVQRAEEKLQQLSEIYPPHPFGDGYELKIADDIKVGRRFLCIDYIQPTDLAQILVGEIVYQLRSALDLSFVRMAKHNSPGCEIGMDKFPFRRKAIDWLSPDKQWLKRHPTVDLLSDRAKKVLCDACTFEGGNRYLWGLNSLRNHDCHFELVLLKVDGISNLIRLDPNFGVDSLVGGGISGTVAAIKTIGNISGFDGLRVDVTDHVLDCDARQATEAIRKALKLNIFIALDGVKECEGDPMQSLLWRMLNAVESVISQFESTLE